MEDLVISKQEEILTAKKNSDEEIKSLKFDLRNAKDEISKLKLEEKKAESHKKEVC